MSEKQTIISNGRVITPGGIIEGGFVLVTGTSITSVSADKITAAGATVIDAGGNYVSPGFIDIHIHGGGGHDFMDGTEHAFLRIAETHARYGTTAMVPTTLTSKKEDLIHTLELYKLAHKNNINGAQFLGMHLEGPYFALNQRGAQDPQFIRDPDPQEYEYILDRYADIITRWSAAPELPGAIEFANALLNKNILAAIAHTDAIYEDVVEAVNNGYSLVTHLYSAMLGVTRRNGYRYAGVVESAFLMDDLDVEIITDGIHLPPPLLKLVYKIKGSKRTALITDAMRAAGMPPGDSVLGNIHTGLKVLVEDGVAKLPDRSAFAGSVATTNRLVRNMVTMADVPLTEAIKMMCITPATIMRVQDKKGSLEPGKDADIVIFDENINLNMTMVNGRIVHQV